MVPAAIVPLMLPRPSSSHDYFMLASLPHVPTESLRYQLIVLCVKTPLESS